MTTGERMRMRRKEIGMSAEKLAELLGKSPATIYRYENGDIEKMPVDFLEPLSEALNTTPAALMGWTDKDINHSLPLSSPASITSKEEELLTLHRQLNEEGQDLKTRRLELKLSQLDVAKMVGVSEATISRWESGNIANMKRDRIYKLSKALQIDPSLLIGFDPVSLPQPDAITPAEAKLLALHRQLNDEGQGRLREYADDLVSSGKYAK